jgi:hypothetical protein
MTWQHFLDLLRWEMASGALGSSLTRVHGRLQFDVEGCNREQKELLQQLKASKILLSATSLGRVDHE